MLTRDTGAAGFRLRTATMDDAASMAFIETQAFADPWPESAFREMLESPRARVTVAVDTSDAVIGYCVLLLVADEGEIANLAVTPGVRRKGAGAALLDHALQMARSAGASEIFLEVRATNAAAQSLYHSRGFATVGRRRGYYQHPVEDALLLRWRPEPDCNSRMGHALKW